ncbi:hypothetical protein DFS34DRAFT_682994 [Phlyctochytrium arcticum]|nr:hypothetical protein DFS34DRAFT_682994 [Phlyctochytrium arcticum]
MPKIATDKSKSITIVGLRRTDNGRRCGEHPNGRGALLAEALNTTVRTPNWQGPQKLRGFPDILEQAVHACQAIHATKILSRKLVFACPSLPSPSPHYPHQRGKTVE